MLVFFRHPVNTAFGLCEHVYFDDERAARTLLGRCCVCGSCVHTPLQALARVPARCQALGDLARERFPDTSPETARHC